MPIGDSGLLQKVYIRDYIRTGDVVETQKTFKDTTGYEYKGQISCYIK